MTIEDVDRRAQEARAVWLESATTGKPISGAELGRRFGMSDRWGRDRVAEARGSGDDTAEFPAIRDEEPDRQRPTAAPAERQWDRQTAVADPAERQWVTADPAEPPLPVNGSNGHSVLPHQRHELPAMMPLTSAPPVVSTSSDAENRQGTAEPASLPPVSKRERKYLILLSMLVLLPGLGISAWSFYGYARSANAPILLAGSASAAIDGIGLFAAYFAARFTNRGQSARFPRLVTYAMIAASVYINWEHASAQHWSMGLHAFVSAPAVASAFAFEILMLELRINERARREKRRRARQAAKVDLDMWLHHPFAVWGARRWESRDRLQEVFPGYKNR